MIENIVNGAINAHLETVKKLLGQQNEIIKVAAAALNTIQSKNTIFLFGNGGSAADAQHIAAELTGRFKKQNRRGLPAIALTTDTSAITSIGNDFGFDHIYARQLEALARPGDLCIGISTSGNSDNVLEAMAKAKELKCGSVGLTGCDGGKLRNYCDDCIIVPSYDTARIQEMHIIIGHIICQVIDESTIS